MRSSGKSSTCRVLTYYLEMGFYFPLQSFPLPAEPMSAFRIDGFKASTSPRALLGHPAQIFGDHGGDLGAAPHGLLPKRIIGWVSAGILILPGTLGSETMLAGNPARISAEGSDLRAQPFPWGFGLRTSIDKRWRTMYGWGSFGSRACASREATLLATEIVPQAAGCAPR